VSATGKSHDAGGTENIANLTLFFAGRLIAHVHVNWLAPVKIRRTLIGGSQRMIVYDDLEPSEKIKVYDKGITLSSDPESVYQMLVGYRAGDMWAPRLDATEALRTEAAHFIACVRDRRPPDTGAESGVRVLRLIEAASRSMANRGQLVALDGPDGGGRA
ncbi:MAG: gfo/Idh/MocA family oxidoreductase, partial [Vicinamibacterales bacterium]